LPRDADGHFEGRRAEGAEGRPDKTEINTSSRLIEIADGVIRNEPPWSFHSWTRFMCERACWVRRGSGEANLAGLSVGTVRSDEPDAEVGYRLAGAA
jgi:hypothetical protein